MFRCYPLPSNMDIGSEDIDRQFNKVKIFPGMPNLRENPFSMAFITCFSLRTNKWFMGESTDFFLTLWSKLQSVVKCSQCWQIVFLVCWMTMEGVHCMKNWEGGVWDPPAHIEAAFEQDNDSGIMISIRISADQYWQKVSHVKMET